MCCSDSRVWSCAQAGLNISSDVNVQWLWIQPFLWNLHKFFYPFYSSELFKKEFKSTFGFCFILRWWLAEC